MIVFIDTNFWLIFYLQKIDLFSELERLLIKFKVVVSQGVIKELKSIQKRSKGKEGTAAKIALELIEKREVEVINDESEVDDFILKIAQKSNKNLVVCTNDKELRRKLRKLGVKLMVMQGKSKLAFR